MTDEQIFAALTPIFQDVFNHDNLLLTAGTTANDVNDWDSLSHLRLIIAIERYFKISFTSVDASSFECVGDMVKKIKYKLGM
ncbi:MAG: acyl carrier protein [Legionellaceae bacterium]|nr:acyl carrier protein [Legionellaceae bacterium]